MSDYQQKVSGSFSERMRLIHLRRKKENLRFWEEFRIIPKGLIWTLVALFVIAGMQFTMEISFRMSCKTRPHSLTRPWRES
jgi:hypothetical protein